MQVTWWEYQRYLEQKPSEWDVIVELLTINETYFYREDKQLQLFKQEILPSLLTTSIKEIKVWSAACSTGEEPYSLAIMALESGSTPIDRVSIIGTDINKRVLDHARRAQYHKR